MKRKQKEQKKILLETRKNGFEKSCGEQKLSVKTGVVSNKKWMCKIINKQTAQE